MESETRDPRREARDPVSPLRAAERWRAFRCAERLTKGLFRLVARARRPVSPEAARSAFGRQRERLQAQFLRAAATGKPRGLRWIACEFGPEWELARDRQTGQLLALAGVTVRFEAEPGGDMEGLPAVANPRQATAVFVCERGRWTTAGRVVFNLGPAEALAHFHRQYERVPEPGGETNRREG